MADRLCATWWPRAAQQQHAGHRPEPGRPSLCRVRWQPTPCGRGRQRPARNDIPPPPLRRLPYVERFEVINAEPTDLGRMGFINLKELRMKGQKAVARASE